MYFTEKNYHVKKLVLHRATMRNYKDYLERKGINVEYMEFGKTFEEIL